MCRRNDGGSGGGTDDADMRRGGVMEDEYRVKMAGVIVENRDRVNPRIISFIIIVVYFYNSDNVNLKVYIEAYQTVFIPIQLWRVN